MKSTVNHQSLVVLLEGRKNKQPQDITLGLLYSPYFAFQTYQGLFSNPV
jgi:hypothetical protein